MANNNKFVIYYSVEYEKKARLYPVIIAFCIPLILACIVSYEIFDTSKNFLIRSITSILPLSLVVGALSYYLKGICAGLSKAIFQFPLFKEDDLYFPTTELLFYRNNKIPKEINRQIRKKIEQDFNIKLYTETKECKAENEVDARKLIASAVDRIRDFTREDKILFDSNCLYGAARNFFGALVPATICVIIIMFYNINTQVISNFIFYIVISCILCTFLSAKYIMRFYGYIYARKLFNTYLNTRI